MLRNLLFNHDQLTENTHHSIKPLKESGMKGDAQAELGLGQYMNIMWPERAEQSGTASV